MKKNEAEIPDGYIRVSSVCKPFTDFSKIDPQVLARKADIGTRVHQYCESYSLGLFVEDVSSDCKNYVDSYKRWFDDSVKEVIQTETRINSEKYRISGQLDNLSLLKYDDGITLIDYKTPDNPSLTWQLQTAGYHLLCEEELNIQVARRICLLLSKTGGAARVVEYQDHRGDKDKFINALELYRFFYG